jgi:UDP-N-acetylglucosamine 2-epimerase (non-hydrolysing)
MGESVIHEIICVVGARPNFMKMAPILDALKAYPSIRPFLVHTGQHYDEEMSRIFFTELGLPQPDRDLEVGSDTHGRQTGRIMIAFDDLLAERKARLVVVVGDVNSNRLWSRRGEAWRAVAHVEASSGIRLEHAGEINRLVTDAISECSSRHHPTRSKASKPGVADPRSTWSASHDRHPAPPPSRGAARKRAPGWAHGGRLRARYPPPAKQRGRCGLLDGMLAPFRSSGADPRPFPGSPSHASADQRVDSAADNLRLADPLGYLDFLSLMASARFLARTAAAFGGNDGARRPASPCARTRSARSRSPRGQIIYWD